MRDTAGLAAGTRGAREYPPGARSPGRARSATALVESNENTDGTPKRKGRLFGRFLKLLPMTEPMSMNRWEAFRQFMPSRVVARRGDGVAE